MTAENPKIDNKEKYGDIKAALKDGELSDEEISSLEAAYYGECAKIHEEAQEACSQLSQEVELYQELQNLPREDIKKLQTLSGIAKEQQDGIIGPNTFAHYLKLRNSVPLFGEASLSDTLRMYENIIRHIESSFKSMGLEQRKNIQSIATTHPDGIYGPNTQEKILTSLGKEQVLQNTFLNKDFTAIYTPDDLALDATPELASMPEVEVPQDIGGSPFPAEEESTGGFGFADVPQMPQSLESREDKIERLIEESIVAHSKMIHYLQQKLEVRVDGDFGPLSAAALIAKLPDVRSFEDAMQHFGIPLKSDGLLEGGGNMEIGKESFRKRYGEFTKTLESSLNLPSGLIEAIIAQETKYGAWKLTSNTGCKGMMQLSGVAIEDMGHAHRAVIRDYKGMFQSLPLDTILNLTLEDGSTTLGSTIPSSIIKDLQTLNNPDTLPPSFDAARARIQDFLKGDPTYFNHTVNMIVGSVYLAGIYHKEGQGDVTTTADLYNASKNEREKYKKNVTQFFTENQKDPYWNEDIPTS